MMLQVVPFALQLQTKKDVIGLPVAIGIKENVGTTTTKMNSTMTMTTMKRMRSKRMALVMQRGRNVAVTIL